MGEGSFFLFDMGGAFEVPLFHFVCNMAKGMELKVMDES